jgi:hypothetical protein
MTCLVHASLRDALGRARAGKVPSRFTPSARTCDRSFSRSPAYQLASYTPVACLIGGVAPLRPRDLHTNPQRINPTNVR